MKKWRDWWESNPHVNPISFLRFRGPAAYNRKMAMLRGIEPRRSRRQRDRLPLHHSTKNYTLPFFHPSGIGSSFFTDLLSLPSVKIISRAGNFSRLKYPFGPVCICNYKLVAEEGLKPYKRSQYK